MIVDLLRDAAASNWAADVCIIGAGAAGITLAREFVGSCHKVLLLESGGLTAEPETQALYDSDVVGLAHNGIHAARSRMFGGTTNLWGGQSLRFDQSDFRVRPWVPHSGWPLTLEVLTVYYDRAETVLQVGKKLTYEQLCLRLGLQPPAFDPQKFRFAVSQWSRCPNFAVAYGDQLIKSANVTLVLHANVTSVLAAKTGTITAVEVKTLSGKTERITARYYVVCCGAIETARLLLASDRPAPHGIGNRYGLVGRYFMDHLHLDLGRLAIRDRRRLHDTFESFVVRQRLYSPKLILADEQQSRLGLLRLLSEVILEDPPDSPITQLKQAYSALRKHAGKVNLKASALASATRSLTGSPREAMRTVWRIYARGRGAKARDCPVRLGVQCENAPCPDSRVSLSDSRDRLGMRRARLNWVVGEFERNTLRTFVYLFAAEIDRLGYAAYDLRSAGMLDDEHAWRGMVTDAAHQMGTARMHESPQFGVVDSACRVHGIDNLYVGSSVVFPTGGHSNPTLTILALCIRIADTLKYLLGRPHAVTLTVV